MSDEAKRFRYEDVMRYLREWHNPYNEPGQYDGNGPVHLLLAILDNLRGNEACADLSHVRESMTDEQATFFVKLAAHIRGDQEIATRWPTLGESLDYLEGLGFTERTGERRFLVSEYTQDKESWFVFRNRDRNAPARTSELVDMKIQLTYRGYVSDREFARFWHPCLEAPPREAPQ